MRGPLQTARFPKVSATAASGPPDGRCRTVCLQVAPYFDLGSNRCAGEELDEDTVGIFDVCPPAGRSLQLYHCGMAGFRRLSQSLVQVIDLERQMVEPFPAIYVLSNWLPLR